MLEMLPVELSFLNDYDLENGSLHSAEWLKTPFSSELWLCSFDGRNAYDITINFQVSLEDGSLLTDPKHASLLLSMKEFLCVQTHPYATRGKSLAESSKYNLIQRAIHILDHFLLNSNHYQLAKYGFSMVTADDIRTFITAISSDRSIKSSIYEPIRRIEESFRNINIPKATRELVISNLPDIAILQEMERTLDLTDDELIDVRIWLFSNKYMAYEYQDSSLVKYRFNIKKYLNYILQGRILGNNKFDKLQLQELGFGVKDRYFTEYLPVPVQANIEDERASEELVASYIGTFRAVSFVNEYGNGFIDTETLLTIEEKPKLTGIEKKQRGRFATLPFDVSRMALEKAIVFFFENGDKLIDSMISVINRDTQTNLFDDLPEDLCKLGVSTWQVKSNMSSKEYFSKLRKGFFLKDLMCVLYGAILIIINSLMARRISELIDIGFSDVVKDEGVINEHYLRFNLAKANVDEYRKVELRPLPYIGVKAITLLSKLQKILGTKGLTNSEQIFVHLGFENGVFYTNLISGNFFNHCFDRFCDYFEMPLDEQGRRYYIRAHQLRRNFAMLFIWQPNNGGIEVLGYFLGHRKPSDTWRYITEACRGKVLSKVKADVAIKKAINGDPDVLPIIQLVQKRYNVKVINIIPESDLSYYIQSLIECGEVVIEPEFFDTPEGESYAITYKVVES